MTSKPNTLASEDCREIVPQDVDDSNSITSNHRMGYSAIPLSIVLHTILIICVHASVAAGGDSEANFSVHDQGEINSIVRNGRITEMSLRILAFPEGWMAIDFFLFGVLILLALELLNFLVKFVGRSMQSSTKFIPVRGKHLDDLSPKDLLFIGLNKAATPPFVYFLFLYMHHEPNAVWGLANANIWNVFAPLPVIFVIYDFFYTLLHWALHVKAIYGYIHKHHHHQKAPSRANVDAVNVHPLEFFLGEYNHLFALYLTCRTLNTEVHVLCAVLFLAIGGSLAGINHTRFDVVVPVLGGWFALYDSKNHDVHHRIPQSNYGQYIMLWDFVFGSYRPYDPSDRVNPRAQLDPKTGKSLDYVDLTQSGWYWTKKGF